MKIHYWIPIWVLAGLVGWFMGDSAPPLRAAAAPDLVTTGITAYEMGDNCIYVVGGHNGLAIAAVQKVGSAGRCQ